jgi:AmmeMemoRadiSam system radical SAM enzyme
MSRTVLLPPDAIASPKGVKPGGWWHEVEGTDRIHCDLCPRACVLRPGDRGFCFVRENAGGEMMLTTYGRSTGFCIDPIEKKPLNHFYPGTSVLSFGTAGCNLGCKFCQNWDISKSREIERLSELATPEMIAAAAQQLGCRSVAFTYNDPVVWAEYAIDTAKACRAAGIKTVAVTAGYITEVARGPFYEFMDAANVDLKAFTEEFYQHLTLSHLQPVLDTLVWLKRDTNVWFEITNLVIPQANDSDDEFRRMCDWILANLGDDVPVHFTAFHPDFRMLDTPNTPKETLLAAYEIARRAGIKHAYTGNVDDVKHQSTYCPSCGACVIERNWYELSAWRLDSNRCMRCGAPVAGVFEDRPGTWGRRRLPVDISRYATRLADPGAGLMSSNDDFGLLAEWCRRNILAMLRGQVAEYSLIGGYDANVPGIELTVYVDASTTPLVARMTAPRGSTPLQASLFVMCEEIASEMRSARPASLPTELRVNVAIITTNSQSKPLA